jgi:thiopeptide-type bacteriocin biosynthesis protein
VPRTVYLGSSDRRLRLNLDDPVHQELLRAELRRHGTTVVHEAPEESAFGWIGRAHEVTMPFASNQEPTPAPTCRAAVTVGRNAGRLPGASGWAYVKLYGSEARAPEMLTTHLRRLLRAWDTAAPTAAWFIRYADPEPHVRLRLRLSSPEAFGAAVQTVTPWATELREEGLIQRVQWDTDQPETGRYGTGTALEAAEAYFVADSAAALAQMFLSVPADLQPAITAASYVDIATGFLGSRPAGHEWLVRQLPRSDGEKVPRNVQALALRLSKGADRTALADLDGGDAVAKTWKLRRTALDRYRQALGAAGIDPAGVLPSLLHMHHNRVAGIDRDAEATCRRIARATALSCTIRPEGAPR